MASLSLKSRIKACGGRRPMQEMLQTGVMWEATRAEYFTQIGCKHKASDAKARMHKYEQLLDEYTDQYLTPKG